MDSSNKDLKDFYKVYIDKILMINDIEIGYKIIKTPYSTNIAYYCIIDVYLSLREFDSEEWDLISEAILEYENIIRTSDDKLNKTSYTNGSQLIKIFDKVMPEKAKYIRYVVKEMDFCLNVSPCSC